MRKTVYGVGGASLAALGAALVVALACGPARSEGPKPGKVRIGTYETRAITAASVRSKFFEEYLADLQAKRKEFEAAGDAKGVAEIEKEGARRQAQVHWQGFGNMPVDDHLAPIKASFPGICKEANISAIASGVVYADDGVELVDVTDLLVKQYEPSEKTLKIITELRKQPPIEFDPDLHCD